MSPPGHKPLFAALIVILGTAGFLILGREAGLPAGKGMDLTYARCQGCHNLQVVADSAGITRPMWEQVIQEMEQAGLELSAEERGIILEYLVTYLGPAPAPEATEEKLNSDQAPLPVAAAQLYSTHCAACHQENGTGLLQQFPPLSGSTILFKDRLYNVLVLLYGLEGKINVGEESFNGLMPSFSHLQDSEIAKLANYLLTAWENPHHPRQSLRPIRPEEVRQARQKAMTSNQVWKYRQELRR